MIFTDEKHFSNEISDTRVFMTVAIDVIVTEINEPIRFSIESMARVFHEHERFYKTPQTSVIEKFTLVLDVRRNYVV